jgi:hypothetical protein
MATKPDTVLELAKPLGWKDTFVRAAKTAVQVFVTGVIDRSSSFRHQC